MNDLVILVMRKRGMEKGSEVCDLSNWKNCGPLNQDENDYAELGQGRDGIRNPSLDFFKLLQRLPSAL